MRISYTSAFLLPALAFSHVIQPGPEPASAVSSIPTATHVSLPQSDAPAPAPTKTASLPEQLDLRQAAQPQANPQAGGAPAEEDSVTVQWVETSVAGVKTWVPKTITVKFEAVPSQLPGPGKGVIGMGTIEGETGKTKTVAEGAAHTMGAQWFRGVAVAAGVGLVGMVA
ncbi:hypothetical protein EJ04DRAFT_523933 [Polyplosphaeria fusca]|uniref:Uncharacterized protein n=1 Tax=Polyplosphaeria fusca TaxID=682080 RepID=A0A9P4QZK4_9PLEO|nr:hypothetical protein EJ04DRAFT_523933 [Polyplosphaeria fusca]